MSESTSNGATWGAEDEPGDREASTSSSTKADTVDPAPEPEELLDAELGPGWVLA